LETVTLRRANEFEAHHRPLAGAILQKTDGGTFRVLRVAEGSASERAGLVTHDEVIAVNGISAQDLTPEEVWQQILAPKITLKVLRRGQPKPESVTLTD